MENEIYARLTKGIRKPRVHKIAVLICGAPGTGKTSNEKHILNDANVHTQLVSLNSDEIIKYVTNRDYALKLTEDISERLISDGYSFIWQASCRFPNAKLRLTKKLKENGYNVIMAITYVSFNIAISRISARRDQPLEEQIAHKMFTQFKEKGHVYLEDPNIDELYLYNNDNTMKLIYERKHNVVYCHSPGGNFYFDYC